VFAGTAAWAGIVAAGYFGLVAVPHLRLLAVAGPGALCAALALRRGSPDRGLLGLAAGAAALVAGSLLAGELAVAGSPVLLAVPAVVATAVACRRWPEAALVATFALTGFYQTVVLYTPIPARPAVDLLLAGLWAAAAWSYLVSGRKRSVWVWPGVALTVLYLLVTLAQALAAESLQQSLFAFRLSAWYMLAAVLVAYAGFERGQLGRVARWIVLVALAVGAYAVLRWIIGPSAKEVEGALYGGGKYNVVEGELRAFGSFQAGHALASWTAPMACFSLAAALSLAQRWRFAALAAAGTCATAVLASEVRAGLLALIAGVLVVMALYQLSRGFPGPHLGVTAAAFACAVGVTAGAFTLAIDSEQARERYTVLATPEKDPAVQRRLEKWNESLDLVHDRPLGRGLGSSGGAHERYSRFRDLASFNLDNSYLKILLDQGIFMLVLYVGAVLLLLFGLARSALLSADREKAGVAIGACGALTAFVVMSATGLYLEGLPALAVWIVVGLGVGQFTRPERSSG
jgi:hypothetical protein